MTYRKARPLSQGKPTSPGPSRSNYTYTEPKVGTQIGAVYKHTHDALSDPNPRTCIACWCETAPGHTSNLITYVDEAADWKYSGVLEAPISDEELSEAAEDLKSLQAELENL